MIRNLFNVLYGRQLGPHNNLGAVDTSSPHNNLDAVNTSKNKRVAVIGAGVAGLRFAKLCADTFLTSEITIFERKPYVGGRLRTKRDATRSDRVVYEKGAWRVSDEHVRTKKLIKDLGLKLQRARHSLKCNSTRQPLKQPYASRKIMAGMSSWGNIALSRGLDKGGVEFARQVELEKGYDEILVSAAGSRTYLVNEKEDDAKTGSLKNEKGIFYTVVEGMQSIPERMHQILSNKDRVSTILGANIVNVMRQTDGTYDIFARMKTKGKDAVYETQKFTFDVCIVAIPPRFIRDWSVSKMYLRSLVHSIGTLPLNHIYIKNKFSEPPPGTFEATPNGLVVSAEFASDTSHSCSFDGNSGGYFQFFYSCGRTARFWNNLRLSHPVRFIDDIKKLFKKWFCSRTTNRGPRGDGRIDSTADIKSHYWPHAVHFWKPSFAFPKHVMTCVKKAVRPHGKNLPRLYCIGEAYSSVQGWTEGALQTAEMAIKFLVQDLKEKHFSAKRPDMTQNSCLIIEGREVDVSLWKHRHPGSLQLIEKYENHKGDLQDLFQAVGHSEDAWRTVFHLSNSDHELS